MIGRYDDRSPTRPRIGYPGTGLIFRFRGTSAQLKLTSDSDKSALTLVIDDGPPTLQLLAKGPNEVALAGQLQDRPHTVEVYKRTETWQGVLTLEELQLANGAELLPSVLPARKLMFVGDSVTCGAGVQNNSVCKADPAQPANDAYFSYGMVLGRKLDAQVHLVCYGGRGLERDYRGLGEADGVLNAPQFFNLAIPSDEERARSAWNPARWQPDAILISLGTNDFSLQKTRPLDQGKWVDEYLTFTRKIIETYPTPPFCSPKEPSSRTRCCVSLCSRSLEEHTTPGCGTWPPPTTPGMAAMRIPPNRSTD